MTADPIDRYADRAIDVDAHEFAPPHVWGALFGEVGERIEQVCSPLLAMQPEGYINRAWQSADDMAMTADNVWTERHTGAPGAFDMRRRLEAMDLMSIAQQLIFPSFALWGQMLATAGDGGGALSATMLDKVGQGLSKAEARALGREGIDAYNDWALRMKALAPDRLRFVGMLKPAVDLNDLMSQVKGLLNRGIAGIIINTGSPPAGLSPASPEIDPFWSLFTAHDVPVIAHVGGDLGFLGSSKWSAAPAFKPQKAALEVGQEPYSLATVHLAVQHFLTVMVLGGVFERHPSLRFGAIEFGAHWLGPLADNLDMWATKVFKRRMGDTISMKPSAYLARNVRVTPFNDIESIAELFTDYPHLANCYCYSTDYPHIEGGKRVREKAVRALEPLGAAVVDQYFLRNGRWLVPHRVAAG
jgi:predicted TIM-barrel fold metal-dependent hydrolase